MHLGSIKGKVLVNLNMADILYHNLPTRIAPERVDAELVTFDTWSNPNSVLMAWKRVNSPLLGGVMVLSIGSLVSRTATAIECSAKGRARSSNVTVIWAGNALFAVLVGMWASLNGSDGGNEESNNEGSEAGHCNYWLIW